MWLAVPAECGRSPRSRGQLLLLERCGIIPIGLGADLFADGLFRHLAPIEGSAEIEVASGQPQGREFDALPGLAVRL